MNNEAMKEVLNELFSHLERLETQSEAILQFLKEKKRVTDKQLAPYLEQAGNASNVKWRAARVRIDHLLEPEHPEKEIKLGKRPELHEESPSASSSQEKRSASAEKENKRAQPVDESGDQKQVEWSDKNARKTEAVNGADVSKEEKPSAAGAAQARSIDGKADKAEAKSESPQRDKQQPAQDKHEQKADSLHHSTEVTEPLTKQQGTEPAAQPDSKEKKSDQEAA